MFHALVLVVYHQYLYRVNTRESDRQELDCPGRILLVLVAHQYMSTLSVSIAPFFVDTVGILMAWASLLCWSVCVVSSWERLMAAVCVCTQVVFSPTTSLFAFHWSIRLAFLLLVEGERCFFFGAWLVVSPVFSTGFPALIYTSLTDTAVELTCRSQVNFCPFIPACCRSWTSSTGKSIVDLIWFLLTVKMHPLVKSRSESKIN